MIVEVIYTLKKLHEHESRVKDASSKGFFLFCLSNVASCIASTCGNIGQ